MRGARSNRCRTSPRTSYALLMAPKTTISVCMIARDNEGVIELALDSVRPWVDELVVVDTGSKDNTKGIARDRGAKVFDFPWIDDFSAARNRSLEEATGAWILWIDTDDTVPVATGRGIREMLEQAHPPELGGFILQVECPGALTGAMDITLVDHVKILRNHPSIRFEGPIHEQVLPSIRRLGLQVAWTDFRVVHSGCDRSAEGIRRKLDRDLRILRRDIQERPNHPFVLFNLGMTLLHSGVPAEARACLEQCVRVAHSNESHVRKAYALWVDSMMATDDLEAARVACWEGLGRYPNDSELTFKLGQIEMRKQDWESAIEAFRRPEPKGPRYFASVDPGVRGYKRQANLAISLEELGRLEEAFEMWLACAKAVPSDEGLWEGVLRLSVSVPLTNQALAAAHSLGEVCPDHIRLLIQAVRARCAGDTATALRQNRTATATAVPFVPEFPKRTR